MNKRKKPEAQQSLFEEGLDLGDVNESGQEGSCTFCDIVKGTIDSEKVYSDSETLAFLDYRPLFLGHVLLIPRAHVHTMADLPHEHVAHFFATAQRLERAVERGLEVPGTLMIINNVISQSVPHLHLHVIPRKERDGLRFWLGPRRRYSDEFPISYFAGKIRNALAQDG